MLARPYVHGVPFDALHAGTLSAWECDDFLHLVGPIVAAFVDYDRLDLLVSGLRLLNQLWLADPDHVNVLELWLAEILQVAPSEM